MHLIWMSADLFQKWQNQKFVHIFIILFGILYPQQAITSHLGDPYMLKSYWIRCENVWINIISLTNVHVHEKKYMYQVTAGFRFRLIVSKQFYKSIEELHDMSWMFKIFSVQFYVELAPLPLARSHSLIGIQSKKFMISTKYCT